MKPKILKIATIILIFTLSLSCDILETGGVPPGIALYKTRGDYFDLVTIGMKGDKIYSIPGLWNGRYNAITSGMEIRNNDTVYTGRYMLPEGYTLGHSEGLQSAFLNMTFKEYLNREIVNAQKELGLIIPEDTLRKYILDKDPYLEFYRNKTDIKRLTLSDSLEIREIILNGEINKCFEKIK